MTEMIRRMGVGFLCFVVLGGSAWGGWFSFEPNMKLLDGTAVARYLEDIEEQAAYLEKGDTEKANKLVAEERIYLIKADRDQTHVEFLGYEEAQGGIFIHVQDESGSKLWASINGLACVGQDGKEKKVTKADVEKGDFSPLPQ